MKKLEDIYEGFLVHQNPQELAMWIQQFQAMETTEKSADENDGGFDFVRPTEHEIWATALAKNLPAEQAAVWKAAEENRKEVAMKESREFLKPILEQNREMHRKALAPRKSEIQNAAELSPERAKTLNELANVAVEASMERWQRRAEGNLLAMGELQRKACLKGNSYYLQTPEEGFPYMMPAWKEGLANFLTKEEQQRCDSMNQKKSLRRTKTFARLLITLLDQKIAFRPPQREALQPIAERLIGGHPSLAQRTPNMYYNFSAHTFLRTAGEASVEEIAPILDAVQCRRWREVADTSETAAVAHRGQPDLEGAAAGAESTPSEPEEFERVISDFLHKRFSKLNQGRSGILVEMDDIERVVSIAPTAVARLRTAALGASEQALLAWQVQVEENVRSQVGDATAANLAQRLEGMQDWFAQRRDDPTTRAIWEKALKTELTDEQRAAWRKEAIDRIAFETRTIAEVVVAEFDRAHSLRIEQFEKLESAILTLLTEYREDMTRFTSSYNGTLWYLQSYQCFMPLCGIPEKEMKEILSMEQWDEWTGSEQYTNAVNNWENIKNNREQRMKNKKEP